MWWRRKMVLLAACALFTACSPGPAAGEGEGEGAPTQSELLDDICAAFAACDSSDCSLRDFGGDLAPCTRFRDVLLELQEVLDTSGCGVESCDENGCAFDSAYSRGFQAITLCELDVAGAPFADKRGYRCSTCAENDAVELCLSGFANYLNTDIVYRGAYGIVDDEMTLRLQDIDGEQRGPADADELRLQAGVFERDDTVDFGACWD